MVRVVILPGNGNCDVNDCCWYPWLRRKLQNHPKVTEVLLHNMPEPFKVSSLREPSTTTTACMRYYYINRIHLFN